MSTTISRWPKTAGLMALVLSAWGTIMVAMPFVGPAGRQVAVVGDQARAAKAILAAGGMIVERRKGAILARSDRPDFVAELYANGARLVVEGRIGAGCFRPAE